MASSGVVLLAATILWLSVAGECRPPFACDPKNAVTKTQKFCQVALPLEDRVRDLLGRLTLQEKIRLLVNNAIDVPRLGIQGYEWWSEALHGVSNVGPGTKFGGDFPGATMFPQVISTAASFNTSLFHLIGRAVSDEARAMYNGGAAGLTFWSPNVNIFRDPRWGRGQETPGEDPTLASEYASSYVRGLQDNSDQSLKVAACCKHFTAYDLDNWNGMDRFHFNAKVSLQDLEDTYNVPFKACVLEGKVASVMCSYNQVNGKPTCADPDLLKETIRGQWNLTGYIVSDCDSVGVFYQDQHYLDTPEQAAAIAIKSGLDLDCGPFLAVHTESAIAKKLLDEDDVDTALANTIMVQMRLGMFDGEPSAQKYGNLGPNDVCTEAHSQLALEAARQGIVLLQNRGQLPLSAARVRSVAIVGPNSDATEIMIGNYAGIACAYTTPLEGIARYTKTIHQPGCSNITCESNQMFSLAEQAAKHADATILVMGLDQSLEAEFVDRKHLLLPGRQQELVTRVAAAARGPVVLVLMSGGPLDVTFAKNNSNVGAILWVGYPGQEGGTAIADVVFGQVNPSGKLPMTWYPQEYTAKVPMTDMAMRADPARDYPGRTYRFYEGPIVFPFGHGLSYTEFVHYVSKQAPKEMYLPLHKFKNTTMVSNALKAKHVDCDGPPVGIDIGVHNKGYVDGSHTVLVYASPPAGKWSSNKQLVSFEKVHVPAGTNRTVTVDIHACKHLNVVDEDGVRRIPVGEHVLHIGDVKHSISLQTNWKG